jgi:hypothetical protein
MILMGDEGGRTQHGNNNTYCHDNELSWLDWDRVAEHADLVRFTSALTAFRHAHPVLRNRWHLTETDYVGSGYPTSAGTAAPPGSRTGRPSRARSRSCCAGATGAAGRRRTTTSTWR